jgi:hypothetical protein
VLEFQVQLESDVGGIVFFTVGAFVAFCDFFVASTMLLMAGRDLSLQLLNLGGQRQVLVQLHLVAQVLLEGKAVVLNR